MMDSSEPPQGDLYANKGYQVLVANVILSILATAAVVLRVYARISRKVALGKDDYLAIVALVRPQCSPDMTMNSLTPSSSAVS